MAEGKAVRGSMSGGRWLLALLLATLAACSSSGRGPTLSVSDLFSASVAGQNDLRFFPAQARDPAEAIGWSNPFAQPRITGNRLDLLAVSAGGPNAAFSAGVYKGLIAAGQWPSHEVITAVSTGALIAPFLFVGAGNQGDVEQLFTGKTLSRLLDKPNSLSFRRGPSKSAARAFASFVSRTMTPQLIARVALEHSRGRRLLVGTANLDTNQLTIWNMGAIASLGLTGIDLFRDVIHAASAAPGVLPPVAIKSQRGLQAISENHGDAAVLAHFYAEPKLLPDSLRNQLRLWPSQAATPGIDILINAKIDADANPVERQVASSGPTAVRTSLTLALNETIRNAAAQGFAVRYAFLPPEWRAEAEFESGYQRDAFDFGYQRAISGILWNEGERF